MAALRDILGQYFTEIDAQFVLAGIANIQRLIAFGESTRRNFCMYRFIRGGDAYDNLLAYDWNSTRRIIGEISTALSRIHEKNYIHGDIKLKNIMVDDTPLLIDFGGFAPVGAILDPKQPRSIAYTSDYCDHRDLRCEIGLERDIYSWGLVILQLMTKDPTVVANRILIQTSIKEKIRCGEPVVNSHLTATGCSDENGMTVISLGLECVDVYSKRPKIADVVDRVLAVV